MKPTAQNIIAYVNKQLSTPDIIRGKQYPPGNNVSIYLPNLDGRTFNALQPHFKSVTREFMGYIKFVK